MLMARRFVVSALLLGASLVLAASLEAGGPPDRVYKGEFAKHISPTTDLRVVDWNINRGKKLDQVVAALRAQDPDVVLLQEVDLEVRRTGGLDIASEIAKRLGMNYVFAPEFEEVGQSMDSDRPALHGQAILARVPIRNVRVLRYEEQSTFWQPKKYVPKWSIMQRRLGGRIALVADVDFHGKQVVVYDLHLESRGFGYTRTMQLEQTLKDAKQYSPSTPVIIGGDFNSIYGPARARERLAMDGFQNCFGDRKVRTHVVFGYLDWLFVRGPIDCEDSTVIRGTKGSDHDAVSARISFDSNRRVATRDGF